MLIYLQMIETGEDRSKFEEIYYEYRNLMYFIAYGDSECGPNGSKKVFLNVGKTFLRALAKDLGLRDAMVSANPGGIAVSGECTLIGMWETGGIYICLYQPAGGGNDVLLYRTVRHCREYKGGYNRFLSRRVLEGGSYVHLLETLSRLRKDRVDDNERAA